jgi:hypothetical protein
VCPGSVVNECTHADDLRDTEHFVWYRVKVATLLAILKNKIYRDCTHLSLIETRFRATLRRPRSTLRPRTLTTDQACRKWTTMELIQVSNISARYLEAARQQIPLM